MQHQIIKKAAQHMCNNNIIIVYYNKPCNNIQLNNALAYLKLVPYADLQEYIQVPFREYDGN